MVSIVNKFFARQCENLFYKIKCSLIITVNGKALRSEINITYFLAEKQSFFRSCWGSHVFSLNGWDRNSSLQPSLPSYQTTIECKDAPWNASSGFYTSAVICIAWALQQFFWPLSKYNAIIYVLWRYLRTRLATAAWLGSVHLTNHAVEFVTCAMSGLVATAKYKRQPTSSWNAKSIFSLSSSPFHFLLGSIGDNTLWNQTS